MNTKTFTLAAIAIILFGCGNSTESSTTGNDTASTVAQAIILKQKALHIRHAFTL